MRHLAEAKRVMVERHLAGRDITDPVVLRAMESVPREEFIPESSRRYAYDDNPLPIGHGQTISQPYIVALMIQELGVGPSDRVLEVGGGSGYQAAVLSLLADHVYSVEIIPELAGQAAERLSRLGYNNVTVVTGDGRQGWPEAAPYDRIIGAAATDHVPEPLEEQLREGGRLILPVGGEYFQDLLLGEKKGGRMLYSSVTTVRFVPMTGGAD